MITCRNVGVVLAATLVAGVLSGSCGGSASETPWPVEPLDAETRPRGEELNSGNVLDTDKLPDNYNKDAGSDEPAKGDPPPF